jgi:hypothetical protein
LSDATNPYAAPKPSQVEKAPRRLLAIKLAVWCGILAPALTGVFSLVMTGMFSWALLKTGAKATRELMHEMPTLFVFVVVMVISNPPLAYGIFKRSRVCAVLATCMMMGIALMDAVIADNTLAIENVEATSWILIAMSIFGVVGTIFHHRHK